MKKLVNAVIVPSIFVLFCCNPADQYPISCKINNSTWYSSSAPAFLAAGKISINAISTLQNQNIIVFEWSQFTVGTFALDSTNNYMSYGDPASGGYYSKPLRPGTLTITEYTPANKKVIGLFNVKLFKSDMTDSISITEGKFNLNYQQ